jgi:threonine/homoserine/homoserine lactone efflux protein
LAGLWVHPLNPKAWAMITTGFTSFTAAGTPGLEATLTIALCLLGLQLVLHPIWAYSGDRIATLLAGRPEEKYLMWSLAALTVASVLLVLF